MESLMVLVMMVVPFGALVPLYVFVEVMKPMKEMMVHWSLLVALKMLEKPMHLIDVFEMVWEAHACPLMDGDD